MSIKGENIVLAWGDRFLNLKKQFEYSGMELEENGGDRNNNKIQKKRGEKIVWDEERLDK